jgi:cytochrome b subunit of formate dehydrogenase
MQSGILDEPLDHELVSSCQARSKHIIDAIIFAVLAIAGIFLFEPAGILFWEWMAGLMGALITAYC